LLEKFFKVLKGKVLIAIPEMILKTLAFVRYSYASMHFDWHIFLGVLIFFILCGILIFQNKIWEEEEYSRNKKWLDWKANAIKSNKGDLSSIYPITKK
tara:strand:- start:299 stop:592 length:294 start_codon:yes stop_codon:yes gene_type:complete